MSGPQSSTRYQKFRARIRDTTPPVCWLCGEAIDLTVRWPDRRSWTLDHVVPLTHGGQLLDPANARPAHAACNSKRQANAPSRTVTSREW